MDIWQAVQNWGLFCVVAGAIGGYYYFDYLQKQQQKQQASAGRRRSEQDVSATTNKRSEQGKSRVQEVKSSTSNGNAKKRKAPRKEEPVSQPTPAVMVDQVERDEQEEMSNKQFAAQMAAARKGANLSGPKGKEQKIRTVKQGSAQDTPVMSSGSSQAGAEADDDMSPTASPAMNAGDVSDMLEPKAKGPSTLRLTAPTQPQKERAARQPKEEVVESKKARQNRLKKEQQRLEREQQERDRKILEEKQRRAAREARGEPARNGIPVSKPPANNAWTEPKPSNQENAAPTTNGNTNGPLLDTFDAESTASSNGGMEASTAATSTTEAEPVQRDRDQMSEEEQMAMAMKQSEDESGWTTVAVPKKQQKKKVAAGSGETNGSGVPDVSTKAPAVKPVGNAKPSGFLALNDDGDNV